MNNISCKWRELLFGFCPFRMSTKFPILCVKIVRETLILFFFWAFSTLSENCYFVSHLAFGQINNEKKNIAGPERI